MEKLEDKFEDMTVKAPEEPQMHPDVITTDYVKALTLPCDRFLCKLADNTPKFKFGGFKIRDMVSKMTLVDVPD